MTSYVPNAFANQSAQASALRSYTPNAFAGTHPGGVTRMAPHLSVAPGDRPYASDVALLQQGGYGGSLPDLDQMWRFSPQTYESQVASMLRQPNAAGALETLKNPQPKYGDTKQVQDEDGNMVTMVMDDEGGWRRQKRYSDE